MKRFNQPHAYTANVQLIISLIASACPALSCDDSPPNTQTIISQEDTDLSPLDDASLDASAPDVTPDVAPDVTPDVAPDTEPTEPLTPACEEGRQPWHHLIVNTDPRFRRDLPFTVESSEADKLTLVTEINNENEIPYLKVGFAGNPLPLNHIQGLQVGDLVYASSFSALYCNYAIINAPGLVRQLVMHELFCEIQACLMAAWAGPAFQV